MAETAPPAELISFPPSVDSETARWILGHHGMRFRELPQSPVGAALRTLRHRAKIPILIAAGRTLSPSRAIADYLDAHNPEQRLLPADPVVARDVEAMWAELNGRLGVWVAQWVYADVFERRALAIRLTTRGVPVWQRRLQPLWNPASVFVMKRGLRLQLPETADRALGQCRRVFEDVGKRLADGRPFLAGDAFSLADLAFCACAAPLLLDRSYGGALPVESEVSPRLREVARELRDTDAGRFARRLYASHYRPDRLS